MSASGEPQDEVERVTLDELVQLMAEELSEADERRLRMRMAEDPSAEQLLAQLRGVDEHFDRPGAAPVPADMPPDVAARLQAHIADLAVRRAEGRLEDPPVTGEDHS